MDLAVLEARWWRNGNSSVRGLFDVLADIHEDNPAAYHYEMFNNRGSLEEIVRRIARRYRNIYIGAHGNQRSISGAEGRRDNKISRTEFRNIIRAATETKKSRTKGLFVGSCMFVNTENSRFLLAAGTSQGVKLQWLAGYAKTVDFVDSSIVDLYFWNTFFRMQKSSERKRIVAVAQDIKKFMPGAYKDLRFNIFLKSKEGMQPLLPAN